MGKIDAVKPGVPRSRWQIAHQDAGQSRLAGRGRPYDPQGLPRLQLEGDAAQDGFGRARVDVGQPGHAHLAPGRRQRHRLAARWGLVKLALDPAIGAARGNRRLPGVDGHIHRRQGPTHEDRARDHSARGHLVAQHQPCSHAQDTHLKELPDELRDRRDPATAAAGASLKGQRLGVPLAPAADQARHHAHGLDHVGVPHGSLGLAERPYRGTAGFLQQRARGELVRQRKREQDQCAGERKPAQQWMKEEYDGEENRCPRRVHDRKNGGSGKKRPERREVSQTLYRGIAAPLKGGDDAPGQHGPAEVLVEPDAQPHHHTVADRFEHAESQKRDSGDQSQEE